MTDIEWTSGPGFKGETWNPLVGCSLASPGCQNCYAMKLAHRGMSPAHKGLTVMGKHGARWTGEVRLRPEKLGDPIGWRKPRMVFVNSMSDLFHPDVPFQFVAAVYGVMAAASQRHIFQVLTKRPERRLEFHEWLQRRVDSWGQDYADKMSRANGGRIQPSAHVTVCVRSAEALGAVPPDLASVTAAYDQWPLPNVWEGISAEDQKRANERIPSLLKTPAVVRWVSAEPLLGRLDLSPWLEWGRHGPPWLDWVVVGGESGPGASLCDLVWIRSLLEQTHAAFGGTPTFVKQLGSRPASSFNLDHGPDRPPLHGMFNCSGKYREHPAMPIRRIAHSKGADPSEWPEDLRIRQWPEVAHA